MKHTWDEPLTEDEQLWRYFKTERLLQTLKDQAVYFAAANQFEDPFEGAVAVQSPDLTRDPRYAETDIVDGAFRQLTRLTKLSCWHRASHENDAMWKLYANSKKGVAICTTPKRLGDSFSPYRLRPEYGEETLWGGCVRYEDLTKVRLNVSMLRQLFHKHIAFKWEREFRCAISLRMAEENGVPVPAEGIKVSFVPQTMIEGVILGPHLSRDDREIIIAALDALDIANRVETSTLLHKPRYF